MFLIGEPEINLLAVTSFTHPRCQEMCTQMIHICISSIFSNAVDRNSIHNIAHTNTHTLRSSNDIHRGKMRAFMRSVFNFSSRYASKQPTHTYTHTRHLQAPIKTKSIKRFIFTNFTGIQNFMNYCYGYMYIYSNKKTLCANIK